MSEKLFDPSRKIRRITCRFECFLFQSLISGDVARSLFAKAMICFAKANYAEAEKLHKQALQILQTKLGETHPKTAQSICELARVYYKQVLY